MIGGTGYLSNDEHDFSPVKEVFLRWFDGMYTMTRRVVTQFLIYLGTFFLPNLFIFFFGLLLISPFLIGALVLLQPLAYLQENHPQISCDIEEGGSNVNNALVGARNAVNTLMLVLGPLFQVWNLIMDAVIWAYVYVFEAANCTLGAECETFLLFWSWVGEIFPFIAQLFEQAWSLTQDIWYSGPLFISTANMTLLVNGTLPENFDGLYYQDGRPFKGFSEDMDPEIRRIRIMQIQYINDAAFFANGTLKVQTFQQRPDIDETPPGCLVCDVITSIWNALFSPVVFQAILNFFKFLFDFGITTVISLIEDLLEVFLPWLEWLLNFVGGDLFAWIAQLISDLDSLFTWVGDVWDIFTNVFSDFGDSVMDTFAQWVDELNAFFDAAFDFITGLVDDIIQAIGGVAAAALQGIVCSLSSVEDAINAAFDELEVLFDVIEDMCDELDDIVPGNAFSCGIFDVSFDIDFDLPSFCDPKRKRSVRSEGDEVLFDKAALTKRGDKIRSHRSKRTIHDILPLPYFRVRNTYDGPITYAAMRDAAYGNLTARRTDLCWEYVRKGFDPYEFVYMPKVRQFATVLCVGSYQMANYMEEIPSIRAQRQSLGMQSPLGLTFDQQQSFNMLRGHIGVLNGTVNQMRTRIKSTHAQVQSMRQESQRILHQTGNRTASAEFKRQYAENTRQKRSYVPGEPVYKRRLTDEQLSRLHHLRESFKAAGETPEWNHMVKTWDKLVVAHRDKHYHVVRQSVSEEPGTAAWHAKRVREEAHEAWMEIGRFLSKQPSIEQIKSFTKTNERARRYVDLYKSDRVLRKRFLESQGSVHSRQKRALGEDVIDFLSGGFLDILNDLIIDFIDSVFCNPLPASRGGEGRYCLPYLDPDWKLGATINVNIFFDFFRCGEDCYRNAWEELQFIARVLTDWANINWDAIVGWIPLIGPLWADWWTFPTGKPPDNGWYCFVVNIASLLRLMIIFAVITFFLIVWFYPIALCCQWLCCCYICLPIACIWRLLYLPCRRIPVIALLHVQEHRKPEYAKLWNRLRGRPAYGVSSSVYTADMPLDTYVNQKVEDFAVGNFSWLIDNMVHEENKAEQPQETESSRESPIIGPQLPHGQKKNVSLPTPQAALQMTHAAISMPQPVALPTSKPRPPFKSQETKLPTTPTIASTTESSTATTPSFTSTPTNDENDHTNDFTLNMEDLPIPGMESALRNARKKSPHTMYQKKTD